MSKDADPSKAKVADQVKPLDFSYDGTSGLVPAVIIGRAKSGFDAGEIDYAINVGAIERMCDSDVLAVVAMLEAAKNSITIGDRVAEINTKRSGSASRVIPDPDES